MAFKSLLIVALLFSVLILCLQGTYADRIQGWGEWEGGHASASASASGATAGGFGNGNWDRQGYGFSSGSCYDMRCDSGPKWYLTGGGDEEKQKKRAKDKIKREGKSSGEGDDEERTAAPRKKRCVWTKSLGEKFKLAIEHIGLDKAKPKNILQFMNEPGLTRREVSSHLQKHRDYLTKLKATTDAGDEDKLDKLGRSSFAFGHLELFFNNNERDQHHSQLLKQQQMGTSIGSAFQPSAGIGSTLPLTAAATNNHGSNQFPNYQQSSTSKSSRSIPQLIGSEQSNHQLTSNFAGSQMMRSSGRELVGSMGSQPAGMFNHIIGDGFANGVRNMNLTGVPMGNNSGNFDSGYMAQFGAYLLSSSSAGSETGASSAYQLPPNLPNNNGDLDQQQHVPVLPPPAGNFNDQRGPPNLNVGGGNVENSKKGFMNNTNTVVAVAPPALINNNNISHEQESVSDDDIFNFMLNLFMGGQDNYQPPSLQEQELVGSTSRQSLNLFESEEDSTLFRTFLNMWDDVYGMLIPLCQK